MTVCKTISLSFTLGAEDVRPDEADSLQNSQDSEWCFVGCSLWACWLADVEEIMKHQARRQQMILWNEVAMTRSTYKSHSPIKSRNLQVEVKIEDRVMKESLLT